MSALLNHAFYAIVRPHDCLCALCLGQKKCGHKGCKKKPIVPIKSRAALGYTPYCKQHALEAARAFHLKAARDLKEKSHGRRNQRRIRSSRRAS